uniref:BTB domain-containing protein n=1 Tax=Anopheles christyi TaxID=43041 RepID=A0A182K3X7_9DIPT
MKNSTIDRTDTVLVNLGEFIPMVQNERIPVHRLILASRNEYSRALLYGGLQESKLNEITLNVALIAFKHLLRYIYTSALELKDMEVDDVLDLLGLVDQYGMTDTEMDISDYLCKVLNIENVCKIFEETLLFNLKQSTPVCYKFLDVNASCIMKHDSLCKLFFDTLNRVLDRTCSQNVFIEQIEIVLAIQTWCKNKSYIEDKKEKLLGK